MSFNGSELIDNPFNEFSSVFTDIIGLSFFLIPISFIAIAIYIKTRTVAASGVWLIASTLMVGTAIFTEYPAVGFIYYLFTVISFVGVIVSIYLESR